MHLPFHTLDVFTDRTFGGNPLGVFPGAAHLPTDLMQRIARELNLSETVFLGPPKTAAGSAEARIFTPAVEVPFAGHPTVGAGIHLATEGGAGAGSLILEEGVGPVQVDVELGAGPAFARFTTAVAPELRPSPLSADTLAAVVGLAAGAVRSDELSPAMASCGLPFHVVPVRDMEAAREARLDLAAWEREVAPLWADHVYIVCVDPDDEECDVHVRMFAPSAGVFEDPATGSAAAALAGYLADADGRSEGTLSWVVRQGVEMGRPSRILIEADRRGGETLPVRVGGHAVPVLSGVMAIPD